MASRSLVLLLCLFAIPATVAVLPDEDFGTRAHRDWPLSGGDWSNSRHSTLVQITRANVSKLAGAWVNGLDGALRTMPVVNNGLLFVPTRTRIHAFNAADGRPAWTSLCPLIRSVRHVGPSCTGMNRHDRPGPRRRSWIGLLGRDVPRSITSGDRHSHRA
jgi:glucose dehydrogenase